MSDIIMQPVKSSNVKAIGYRANKEAAGQGTLQVQFKSGATYIYHNVLTLTYHELLSADSVGRYFNQHIKGIYPHEKKGEKRDDTNETGQEND